MWLAGIVQQEMCLVTSRKMLLKVVSKVVEVEVEEEMEVDGVDVHPKHPMCIETATRIKLRKKAIKQNVIYICFCVLFVQINVV